MSISRLLIIAFTLSLFITTPGFSVTEVPKTLKPIVSVGLTPTIGGYFFEGSQSLDPTLVYGLKFSYDKIGSSFHDSLGVEGTFNYFTTKSKSDKETANGMIFRVASVYSITPRNEWVPFMALGAGWIQMDRNGKGDGNPLLDFGLGVKYFYEEYLAIRLDARQLFVYDDVGTTNNYEVSTGLTYFFGKERKKKAPPAAKPKPITAPAVPKITEEPEEETAPAGEEPSMLEKIGAIGAAILGITTAPPEYEPPAYVTDLGPRSTAVPPPQRVPAPAAPAAPAPVPAAPPAAPAGEAVQPEAPLVTQRTTKTLTFEFDFSSPRLRPIYRGEIAAAAALINAAEKSSVLIEGHTDNVGKHQPNVVLSEKRARSVKDALVESGVDPKAVAIKGYGFTKPKASNKTPEGRQKNRRATAVISVIKTTPAKQKK